MFQLLLGLKSKEGQGYQQISSFVEIHLEELLVKIEYHFPFLTTQVYDWLRDPFCGSSAHP